jgi:uncharacterized protein YprB with RNaseH-like and TPR domain
MGELKPVAFDIETTGLEADAAITVVGLAHELGEILILNTAGRRVQTDRLEQALTEHSIGHLKLSAVPDEPALLERLAEVAETHLDEDRHYLTAYHAETWNGGFDLPFVRTACVQHDVEWPFPSIAYADVLEVVDRFATNGETDLVGVYEQLRGRDTCDPFDDSEAAVEAFEDGDWGALLRHNIADIRRTRELAILAGSYVPQSDFRMKNLSPPQK